MRLTVHQRMALEFLELSESDPTALFGRDAPRKKTITSLVKRDFVDREATAFGQAKLRLTAQGQAQCKHHRRRDAD